MGAIATFRDKTESLIQLLTKSGLVVKDVQATLKPKISPSPKEIMVFFEASFFGNYLSHVPVSLRELAKVDIAFELKKYRVNGVIRCDGYKLTAIAQKPER